MCGNQEWGARASSGSDQGYAFLHEPCNKLITPFVDDDPSRRFDGYTNEEANKKKVLRDVMKKGDAFFLTGDLVKRIGPHVYFVDRIGDTFRWKGENSSTREVEEEISTKADPDNQIEEINIYGVKIENMDGKACMVSCKTLKCVFLTICTQGYIRLKEGVKVADLDLDRLYNRTAEILPHYQVPLFLRITEGEFELTSTFKHKKVALRREAFDPSQVSDKLVFRNPGTKSYMDIDDALYAQINEGKFKL